MEPAAVLPSNLAAKLKRAEAGLVMVESVEPVQSVLLTSLQVTPDFLDL